MCLQRVFLPAILRCFFRILGPSPSLLTIAKRRFNVYRTEDGKPSGNIQRIMAEGTYPKLQRRSWSAKQKTPDSSTTSGCRTNSEASCLTLEVDMLPFIGQGKTTVLASGRLHLHPVFTVFAYHSTLRSVCAPPDPSHPLQQLQQAGHITICTTPDLLLKHSDAILATYIWRHVKHLKHTFEILAKTPENTWKSLHTYATSR